MQAYVSPESTIQGCLLLWEKVCAFIGYLMNLAPLSRGIPMPGWAPIPAVPSAVASIFYLQPGTSRPRSPSCKPYTHTRRMPPFSPPPDACTYCAMLESGAACPCLGPRTGRKEPWSPSWRRSVSRHAQCPAWCSRCSIWRREPCLRDCGSLGLKPGEQTWKDFKLLANTAQREARSSERNWG